MNGNIIGHARFPGYAEAELQLRPGEMRASGYPLGGGYDYFVFVKGPTGPREPFRAPAEQGPKVI